ncbi:MAG: hypothetical protein ACREJU_08255 [Nitrospiraceae bacterium]
MSPPALRVATILSIQHLVHQVQSYKEAIDATVQEADIRKDLHQLRVRQQLTDRLLLASLDTANVAGEIDCEVARTDRRADVLEAEEAHRHRNLILLAILGDAAVGVVSGLFGLFEAITAEAIASIAGGSVSTSAGMTATFGRQKETQLEHSRNPLREVWERPSEPTIFPSSVWRYLNWPLADDPSRKSRRDKLITEWKEEGWLGEPGSKVELKRKELFFGDGGTYTVEDLRTRSRMMQVLKTHVNLLSQDIDLLLREILITGVRDTDRPPAPSPPRLKTKISLDERGL